MRCDTIDVDLVLTFFRGERVGTRRIAVCIQYDEFAGDYVIQCLIGIADQISNFVAGEGTSSFCIATEQFAVQRGIVFAE